MRRVLVLLLAALLMLATAACGGTSGSDKKKATGSGDAIKGLSVSGTFGAQPTVKVSSPIKVTEAKTKVVTTGTGKPVVAGKKAMFDLYVARGRDGKKIYSDTDNGTPSQVQMQASQDSQLTQVITKALVGKPRGSRVAIAAPVPDVFGAAGAPQYGLKKTDTVLFVIDVLSVEPTDVISGPQGSKVTPPAHTPVVEGSSAKVTGIDFSKAPKKAPKKLEVIPLVKGTGPTAKAGRLVTFNYYGAVYGSKKPFDSSFSRGAPTAFGVGVHGLIKAWDDAIPGLKRGSRVLIIAPPSDAYGSKAQQGIPANSTLAFVVDVLGVDS